jgi:hypothetical protein
MSERQDIVKYLRNWSAGLLETAITDFPTREGISKLNAAAKCIDGIASHIENGDHYDEEYH